VKIIISMLSGICVALFATVLVFHQADQRALNTTKSELQSQINRDNQKLVAAKDEIANLNQPDNPLSAYTQVCNIDNTNSFTGNVEIYYYPCTDSVIPSP
jgi:cell division protein FtsL